MNKETVITSEGLKRLEKELDELKTVTRLEIAEKIKIARSFGDLSENSEYDEAKNDQAVIEGRIAELEAKLNNVRIWDESELTNEKVTIGSRVVVKDIKTKNKEEYQVVGSTETDPLKGRISDESPVGKAFLGCTKNDLVEIETPGGIVSYKILKIS